MREQAVLSPSQVGQYLKGLMDRDRLLANILVRGEISNYRSYPSGYSYFSLKDAGGTLRCVLFAREARALRFQPQNGMQVVAAGRVTVFPRDGEYQLQCARLIPEGTGDLHLAFEQLKEKLYREGLFDPAHKKELPAFPRTIALVTSPAGDAVHDMIRVTGARWPMARLRVLPVHVQGELAAEEIAAAIRWANWKKVADLIITGRGGGTMEDLWAFNEECVARAIYDSEIPVISAVGHEPDVTIADFAADVRASTPTNAAELAVPDRQEVAAALEGLGDALEGEMVHRLDRCRRSLERLADSRVMTDPAAYFRDKRLVLGYQSRRLAQGLEKCAASQRGRLSRLSAALPRSMERTLSGQKERLGRTAASLDALSPLKVLGRGYAIARREDGKILSSVSQARAGDRLSLRLSDGSLDCEVTDIRR